MNCDNTFRKNLTTQEISLLFQNALDEVHRPADERILTDVQLCQMLNVSKRLTATWRAEGLITYSKVKGVIFYKLSDVLAMVNEHAIKSINSNVRIKN